MFVTAYASSITNEPGDNPCIAGNDKITSSLENLVKANVAPADASELLTGWYPFAEVVWCGHMQRDRSAKPGCARG